MKSLKALKACANKTGKLIIYIYIYSKKPLYPSYIYVDYGVWKLWHQQQRFPYII